MVIYIWHDCAFFNQFINFSKGNGVLNAFRTDKESKLKSIPKLNNDISRNGYATKPLNEFIEILQKYSHINTDRLHVAICGTLLNKKVRLFPNSYFKNKAVFDYSLCEFSNISFISNEALKL